MFVVLALVLQLPEAEIFHPINVCAEDSLNNRENLLFETGVYTCEVVNFQRKKIKVTDELDFIRFVLH